MWVDKNVIWGFLKVLGVIVQIFIPEMITGGLLMTILSVLAVGELS